jgi:hypothetical protein
VALPALRQLAQPRELSQADRGELDVAEMLKALGM